MGFKSKEEWLAQANYDIGTAEAMFDSHRNIYCIFICHLAIVKALKSLWSEKFQEDAPKTHDLYQPDDKIRNI